MSFLLSLVIFLLILALISSSFTALMESVHLEKGFGPSGVVKLMGVQLPKDLSGLWT